MTRVAPASMIRCAAALSGLLLALPPAQAQTYTASRTSSFTYQANGLLASETVEPDQPQLCVTTTYTYADAYGNKTGALTNTANCAAGAAGLSLFDSRTSSTTYAAQTVTVAGVSVAIPTGTFATSALNALNHSESRTYDPRFGAVTKLTGPNALDTNWTLDDFGRKVLETRADGTKTAAYFCWLGVSFNGVAISTASNSPGCHNGSAPSALVPAPHAAPRAHPASRPAAHPGRRPAA